MKLELLSPAKLNLFFRVLYKRSDGYHEIASLYQAVSLFDTISLEFSNEDLFSCSEPSLEKDPSNSILRALSLFRSKTNLSFCLNIKVDKKIPLQAGVGGGSSNAATTLWGCNELCGKPLTLEQLISLGKEIGSDVPFFFSLGSAYCTGRGEKIDNVLLPKKFSGWLARPSFGTITSHVYKAVDVSLLSQENPRMLLNSFWKDVPNFYNDLERAAFSIDPRLKETKANLLKVFDQVVMTGSGSCFFCLGKSLPSSETSYVTFYPIVSCQREEKKWYLFP